MGRGRKYYLGHMRGLLRSRHYRWVPALLATVFMLAVVPLHGQFSDDFSDGDLTTGTSWSGDLALFTVIDVGGDLQLRSNSPGAANYQVSTPSTLVTNARWEWEMDLRFSTSGANYVDVYLMADNADLTLAQNGWFVRAGGTADRVELFKRVAGVNTSVLVSPDGIVNSSTSNPFRIRVERTASLSWTLGYDDGITGTFSTVGPSVDAAVTTGSHFGIRIEQSSAAGPVNNHFFDDIVVGAIPVDLTPPSIVSVTATSATNVDVLYSEPLNAGAIGSYDIIPFIGVSSATQDGTDPALVHVTPAIALTSGVTYSLLSSGAEDLVGNVATNVSTEFTWSEPVLPQFRDVVINELMADPSPSQGLPDAEFVELFNATTNKVFDLAGWKLSDGSSTAVLPTYILGPGEHVLITSATNGPLFASIAQRLTVPSLPSLNNDADDVSLAAPDDSPIDAVSYTLDWYRDGDKEDGGWTLEQINPFTTCTGPGNWRASNALAGGTPGAANSVLDPTPDTTPPTLVGVQVIGNTQLELVFSEPMDAVSLGAANYVIQPPLPITVAAPTFGTDDRARLVLAQPIPLGVVHTVSVTGATDCPGNAIAPGASASFALPEPAEPGDLVINEVLYDPVVGGSDFVEIYNRSEKTISLSGLQLAREVDGQLDDPEVITAEGVLLLPGEYILLTTTTADIAARYPQSRTDRFLQMTLPGYNDGEGTVLLTDGADQVLDRFDYSDDLHFPLVNDPEGYSLERVDPDRPTEDASNWQTASEQAGRATPGYRNSQYAQAPEPSGELTIEPSIFSPDNDGFQDVLTMSYRFEQPGFVGNLSVYDIAGREVRKLLENVLLGAEGAVSWDGLLDDGSKGRMGPYVVLLEVYDLAGNVEKYRRTVTLAHRL